MIGGHLNAFIHSKKNNFEFISVFKVKDIVFDNNISFKIKNIKDITIEFLTGKLRDFHIFLLDLQCINIFLYIKI